MALVLLNRPRIVATFAHFNILNEVTNVALFVQNDQAYP